jgi:hypothetical protein
LAYCWGFGVYVPTDASENIPETSSSGMPIIQRVPNDLGAFNVDRMLEGAADAIPPYFTTPKSVGSASKNNSDTA